MSELIYRSHRRTIWVVDAETSRRGGLHTPHGPHLVLRDEPEVGETIVARIVVRPSDWNTARAVIRYTASTDNPRGVVRLWSAPAYTRQLGDDSDAPEPRDFTVEVIREILCVGDWACASCEVRHNDSMDPVLHIPGCDS